MIYRPVDVEVQEITSDFGERVRNGNTEFHPGLDLRTWDFKKNKPIPIVVPEDCEVSNVGCNKWGDYAFFKPIYGPDCVDEFRMWHVTWEDYVQQGAQLNRGMHLGVSQIKGLNTQHHLHFEVWKNGKAIDPRVYFDAAEIPYRKYKW